jgi:hypothetical protein
MLLPLERWDVLVKRHLDLISAGAAMCARHCEELPVRPGFETYAEADLLMCENALREALVRVQFARAYYCGLEIDR